MRAGKRLATGPSTALRASGWPFGFAQGTRSRRRVTGLPVILSLVGLLLGAGPVAAQVEVVEYYATDALGSVRVVFNADGQVVARADYQPFGELFAPVGELPPQQFTGQARDGEAGLDYFGARFYQPRHGRFTQVDPVYAGLFDPQQWNRYTYARANPLSFVDPDGRAACGTGSYHWGGHSWVPSFNGCGSADLDRRGNGGGGGGMSTVAWGLGGLAWGGWGGGWGYTDPGRGAGGGRSGGGPGSSPTTPQDGTVVTTPGPETPSPCSGPDCGSLITTPLTEPGAVVAAMAPKVQELFDVGTRTPRTGTPNSVSIFHRTGESIIRFFGPDGGARLDINLHRSHGAGDLHVHRWVNGVRQGGVAFVDWVRAVTSGRITPSPIVIVNPCLVSLSLCRDPLKTTGG